MKMIQHQILTITGAIGLLLFASTSYAEVDVRARNLASHCAACHGTNGNNTGGMPVLAGMDKALFMSAMKDFKSGARPATVMHNHAKGYTEEEFVKLADFFAAQKR